jgi:hypothetical protein
MGVFFPLGFNLFHFHNLFMPMMMRINVNEWGGVNTNRYTPTHW